MIWKWLAALYFWGVRLRYPSTKRLKYSNCTVNLFNIRQEWPVFKICWGYALPSSLSSTLKSPLWSWPDAIINARDTMQNLGQTRIFYNLGQTRLTRRKCDPDDPGDPTRFQPCPIRVLDNLLSHMSIFKNLICMFLYRCYDNSG